jgi:hypothetical protein
MIRKKQSKYIDSLGHEIVTFVPGTRDLYCPVCKKIYEKRNMQRLVSVDGRFVAVARYYGYKNGKKTKTELIIKNGPTGRPKGRDRQRPQHILDVNRY